MDYRGACLYLVEVWAVEWAPDGVIFTVTYDEPTQNPDGSPLTDFSHTNVYCQISGRGPQKLSRIDASKPTGGGTVKTKVKVPMLPGQSGDVLIWVTATNKMGGESAASKKVLRPIFR